MDSPTIEFLLQLIFNLSLAVPGGAALIVVLISIGKMLGWVKDEHSQVAVNILNVLFALVIGVLAIFFPTVNIPGLDAFLQSLAGTLTAFLPLLAILIRWLAPYFYKAVRGVPLIGFSYSLRRKG